MNTISDLFIKKRLNSNLYCFQVSSLYHVQNGRSDSTPRILTWIWGKVAKGSNVVPVPVETGAIIWIPDGLKITGAATRAVTTY